SSTEDAPMDRSHLSASQHPAVVRTAGNAALDLLLPTRAGGCGELVTAARTGRTVLKVAILWQPQDGCPVRRGPPSRPAPGRQIYSYMLRAWRFSGPTMSGARYYLHSDARRLSLPGRGDGLVQPLRAQLETLQRHGDRLLAGRAPRCFSLRPARNLELRSGR